LPAETALFRVEATGVTEMAEYFGQVLQVFLERSADDDDIIEVDENMRLKLGLQNDVQQSLKCSGSGVKFEWHNLELH